MPPLGVASPPSAALAAAAVVSDERAIDDRRLDALENKLATLVNIPLRSAAGGTSQLAPLPSSRGQPATLPASTTPAGGAASVAPASASGGSCFSAAVDSAVGARDTDEAEAEVIEDDIAEESFEEDEDDYASAGAAASGSLSLSSGAGPPLPGGASPSSLASAPRSRTHLSPLETSMVSVDESVSPSRLGTAL